MEDAIARIELDTPGLWLRTWQDADLAPLTELRADPPVMRYFPALLSRDGCAAAMARYRIHFVRDGFGFWRWSVRMMDASSADASLAGAFERLQLPEVVAYTAAINEPSRALMDELGMRHEARDDFDHPDVPMAIRWVLTCCTE